MDQLSYRKINFEEFCAAATGPYRLEPLEKLEQISAHHLSILNRRETLTNWSRPKLESVPADVLSNSSSPQMPGEELPILCIFKSGHFQLGSCGYHFSQRGGARKIFKSPELPVPGGAPCGPHSPPHTVIEYTLNDSSIKIFLRAGRYL